MSLNLPIEGLKLKSYAFARQ